MAEPRKQHFVTFLSPGTFYDETTKKPIGEWNTATAARMARDVLERYNAKPFGFQFSTAIVAEPIPDGDGGMLQVQPKEIARSGKYFLGGEIQSYDDVVSRKDETNSILISNMRGNGFWFVITNTNSWKSTTPFDEKDVVVNPDNGEIMERGDSPERKAYRERKNAEREAEYAAARAAE